MASVTYDNATIVYPGADSPSVDQLDLDIADGEFLVLVGPSGCGKSTSLRMLAGLEEVTFGLDPDRRPRRHEPPAQGPRHRDGVPELRAVPAHDRRRQHGLRAQDRRRQQGRAGQAGREAAKLLDLSDYLDRKPKALSGGQRQRVAMGRAIVREPQVFCMDEPLSNLDAKLRVSTRTQIASLQRRLGVTTVYVTHDQVEAMTMGDRVAVLKDGLLMQCDTPRELYDHPRNVFVAGFIGSPAMNLITAPLAADGAHVGKTWSPLDRSVIVEKASEGGAKDVTFGFRPESVHVGGPDDAGFQVVVNVVEELGSDAFLYGSLVGKAAEAEGTPDVIIARTDPRNPPHEGRQGHAHDPRGRGARVRHRHRAPRLLVPRPAQDPTPEVLQRFRRRILRRGVVLFAAERTWQVEAGGDLRLRAAHVRRECLVVARDERAISPFGGRMIIVDHDLDPVRAAVSVARLDEDAQPHRLVVGDRHPDVDAIQIGRHGEHSARDLQRAVEDQHAAARAP